MYSLEQAKNGGWIVRKGTGVEYTVSEVLGAFTDKPDLLSFLADELPNESAASLPPPPAPPPGPPVATRQR